MAKAWGPVRVGNEIQRVRIVFKHAADAGLIERAMRYGPGFKRPSRKVLRVHRAQTGLRMFEADEMRLILGAAGRPMRCMVLLAINAGLGNRDIGELPTRAIDFKTSWLDYPRPKTGIARRVPLWSETLVALKEARDRRPTPKDPVDDRRMFITKRGLPWAKDAPTCPLAQQFGKLGIHRKGLGFYAIRHSFATIGSSARDEVALTSLMGHSREDMASVYRERIDDARLRSVTDHVRQWLFGDSRATE